ncbi:MAG: aminoglycoside phosphotransferase family protein [Bacillota bacterium]
MTDIKLIGQGRTADIFEHQDGKVLKLYKQEFPLDAINQEFAVSKFVYSLGIKTPRPFEIIQVNSRTGVIFERVFGISLLKVMTMKPWSIDKYSKKLAKLHFEIHRHQTHDGTELLRHQKGVLIHNINQAPFLSEHEKEEIVDFLQELSSDNKLCHGDFHPDNVLVDEDNLIIDWMTGTIGNPAGDVARTVILLSLGTMPEGTPKIVTRLISILRNRIKSVYVKQYLKLSRLDFLEIDRWILPVAAARLTEWLPDEEKKNLLNIIRVRLREIS